MGTRKGYIGKVLYAVGLVKDRKTEDSFESQTDAWKKEAECGCGIDCCEKRLVLTDQTTGDHYALFFADGSLFYQNLTTNGTAMAVTAT